MAQAATVSYPGKRDSITSQQILEPRMSYAPYASYAPAMTSMVATPTYASAVPTASMYAAPTGASMYMPAASVPTTTVAAPATTAYAAPAFAAVPTTTAAPSYVAPPAMAAAMPQFSTPAPVSLTAGLVEPARLEAERVAYEKALADQLNKQVTAVGEEANIKKQMLRQTADTQIKQMELQLDERLKMAALQVDKEASDVVNGLNEAAIQQKTAMDERVAIAVADFQKKKAMEDMALKSYQLQKQWYDGEAKLMAQYQAAKQAGLQRGILT